MATRQKPEVSQLHRISGQLVGIEKMINEKSSVCAVLQQIEAVRGNLKSLEKRLIETQMKKIKDKSLQDCVDYLCKIV